MAGDTRGVRLGLLGVVALVLIGVLGTRLWFLQVVDADKIAAQVQVTKFKEVNLPPERGRIFDVKGRILADNERVLRVVIDQDVIRTRRTSRLALFGRLAGALKTTDVALEIRYCGEEPKRPGVPDKDCRGGLFNPYLPFPAADDVDEATALFLRERIEDYPGVDVEEGWRRKYLYAPTASQIIGYLGRIPDDNEKTDVNETEEYLTLGYSLNDLVGSAGIERQFETELRGTPGYASFEIDARGRVLKTITRTEPVPGKDVQLTIDLEQQLFAEQTLETMLKRARSVSPHPDKKDPRHYNVFYKAPAGSVVVEKSGTGEIVAMASYPTFDNRWFSAGISKKKFDQLFPKDYDKNPDTFPSPLVNRAIQGRYNVGSTFKPFTAYAALHTGFLQPDERILDTGTYELQTEPCIKKLISKCKFKNAYNFKLGKPTEYGDINVSDALAVSSDFFFYRIGAELYLAYPDNPVLQDNYRLFGFGEKTGIDLPFEYKGVLPDAEVKKRLAAQHAISTEEGQGFNVGDAIQMAIGQGLNAVTPLQLTNAYAVLANGCCLLKPLIVHAIYPPGVPDDPTRAGYANLEARTPETLFTTVSKPDRGLLDQAPLLSIRKGLACVVEFSCGRINTHQPTAQNVFLGFPHATIPIAGKTGTAQGKGGGDNPENDSSVFVAFQTGDPGQTGYTIGAYLEKAGYGKRAAAPVVRCLMLAVNGQYTLDQPVLSDELNVNSPYAAPPQRMPSAQCLDDGTKVDDRDRGER
jgi:penicillin-binding protein 2